MSEIPEYVNHWPNLCGWEAQVKEAMTDGQNRPTFLPGNGIDFGRVRSACAIALHMHQPLIPAGGHDLHTAAIISNLQYMY